MTEPEHIEFTERIDRPLLSRGLARGGIVLGAAALFVVGVMSVMGASPSPSTGADPAAGASNPPVDQNGTAPDRGFKPGGHGFGRGGFGFGGVTITAISGSNLSLETEDGWTRTIAVTSTTTITRAGTTVAVGDLKVGDEIVFRQDRQDDGTYTITEIRIVLPTVAGQVTKVDGSTITITRLDGTTETINVDGDTTFKVEGVTDPSISDIKVDSFIVAQGTQAADGSLDAESVASGFGRGGDHRGFGGFPGFPGGKGPDGTAPDASPAPSTTPS